MFQHYALSSYALTFALLKCEASLSSMCVPSMCHRRETARLASQGGCKHWPVCSRCPQTRSPDHGIAPVLIEDGMAACRSQGEIRTWMLCSLCPRSCSPATDFSIRACTQTLSDCLPVTSRSSISEQPRLSLA